MIIRAIIAGVFLTTPAFAVSCAPHEEMLAYLKKQFGEEVISHGVMTQNNVVMGIMETTVSSTKSWTVIGTGTDNITCIFMNGENYDQQALKPPGERA